MAGGTPPRDFAASAVSRGHGRAQPLQCRVGWGPTDPPPEGPQHRGACDQGCTSAGEELIPGDLGNICALAASERNEAADYPRPGQRAAASPFVALGERLGPAAGEQRGRSSPLLPPWPPRSWEKEPGAPGARHCPISRANLSQGNSEPWCSPQGAPSGAVLGR